MEAKRFKAVSIMVKESLGRGGLMDAFNEWAEKEQPSKIVHVHYFHDPFSRSRGYQVLFQESSPNGDGAAYATHDEVSESRPVTPSRPSRPAA